MSRSGCDFYFESVEGKTKRLELKEDIVINNELNSRVKIENPPWIVGDMWRSEKKKEYNNFTEVVLDFDKSKIIYEDEIIKVKFKRMGHNPDKICPIYDIVKKYPIGNSRGFINAEENGIVKSYNCDNNIPLIYENHFFRNNNPGPGPGENGLYGIEDVNGSKISFWSFLEYDIDEYYFYYFDCWALRNVKISLNGNFTHTFLINGKIWSNKNI